jgi:hypothetical protein
VGDPIPTKGQTLCWYSMYIIIPMRFKQKQKTSSHQSTDIFFELFIINLTIKIFNVCNIRPTKQELRPLFPDPDGEPLKVYAA